MDVSLPGDVKYDMVPELPAAVRHRLIAHVRMHAPPPRDLGHEDTPAAPVSRVRSRRCARHQAVLQGHRVGK